MRFTHEYDANGNHRLVADRGRVLVTEPGRASHFAESEPLVGQWAGYGAPALLVTDDKRFVIYTNAWSVMFDSDTVFTMAPVAIAPTSEVASGL